MAGDIELVSSDTQLACLDDLDALAFVEDRVSTERRTAVAAHLVRCKTCSELVVDFLDARKVGETQVPKSFGIYQLGALIAQGGMGRIYRAFDTTLQRDVALKVPRAGTPSLVRRFEREAAITARLQHPGIVPIHAGGHSDDGTPFYVMRLVDGRTLDRIVDDTHSATARLALVEHVVSIAETMAYVHDKRIVHRDLKPNNVLIGEFGETLIIDWGLAKQVADGRDSLPVIGFGTGLDTPATRDALRTKAGDVLGTPAFMPPEQAAGEPVDERGDVYALGALVRYVIAGRVTAPSEELDAPAPLLEVCKRALAARPENRYANAGELVIALRAAITRPAPRSARRGWIGIAVAGAVIAIAAVIAWKLLASKPAGPAEQITLVRLPPNALRPALSASGKRVAYGNHNRLEVRDLETGRQWTRPAWLPWPYTVEFPSDHIVMYSEIVGDQLHMKTWNLVTNTTEQVGAPVSRYWIGSLEDGPVWIPNHHARGLEIETRAGSVAVPSKSQRSLRLFAISPDHRRLAFVEHGESGDVLRIVEGAHGRSFTVAVEDVAALTFLDPDTILYASGTLDGSTLLRMPIVDGVFGPPEPVFTTARGGWMGTLAASNGRVVGSWINSSFESRLLERTGHAERHLDKVTASAALGWRDVVSYWVFNSATRQLERHSSAPRELATVATATLPGDPVNATMAGELLIVTLRGGDGREVIAVSPDDATPRWTAARGVLSFVRCAGDRAPPCIAGKRNPSGTISLVRIDPFTGAVGELLVPDAEIADAAIDALGTTMAWVVNNSAIHVRALDPQAPAQILSPARNGILTLAFDPTGGILASTSLGEGRTISRFIEGRIETVTNAGQTIVSLIRPSADGTQLLYRARTLSSELVEVRLP